MMERADDVRSSRVAALQPSFWVGFLSRPGAVEMKMVKSREH